MISIQTNFAKGKEKYINRESATPYTTAIIDPDWPYSAAPGRPGEFVPDKGKGRLWGYVHNYDSKSNKYKQEKALSIEELKKLPIDKVVGGYLFLWTVGPFLVNGAALELMDSWGFTPRSILTWAKYDTKANHGYGGVGFWFYGNAEFCVVGSRKGWPSIRTGRSSLIIAPKNRGNHSEKPGNIHNLCEDRFPGPYLEIFGRRRRSGWTVIGNEAPDDGLDITDSLSSIINTYQRASFLKTRKYLFQ